MVMRDRLCAGEMAALGISQASMEAAHHRLPKLEAQCVPASVAMQAGPQNLGGPLMLRLSSTPLP